MSTTLPASKQTFADAAALHIIDSARSNNLFDTVEEAQEPLLGGVWLNAVNGGLLTANDGATNWTAWKTACNAAHRVGKAGGRAGASRAAHRHT